MSYKRQYRTLLLFDRRIWDHWRRLKTKNHSRCSQRVSRYEIVILIFTSSWKTSSRLAIVTVEPDKLQLQLVNGLNVFIIALACDRISLSKCQGSFRPSKSNTKECHWLCQSRFDFVIHLKWTNSSWFHRLQEFKAYIPVALKRWHLGFKRKWIIEASEQN